MKYFTLSELTRSHTAATRGIDNAPDTYSEERLRRLVGMVLDPLREEMQMPIYVNSGFRCRKLNEAVGGVYDSFHTIGAAADIRCGSWDMTKKLFQLIKQMYADRRIPVTECYLDTAAHFIHIAYAQDCKVGYDSYAPIWVKTALSTSSTVIK